MALKVEMATSRMGFFLGGGMMYWDLLRLPWSSEVVNSESVKRYVSGKRAGAAGCGVMQSALRLLHAVLHKRSFFGRAFAGSARGDF